MKATIPTLLGRPVWYELLTTDTRAAETFYRNVVGWTSAPFEGSPGPYTVFKRSGEVQVAGLMKRPEGMNMPPFWAMYVAVPNFEDAVTHIKRLGGSELSPVIDVPGVGRPQLLKDPQGAAFNIIQQASTEERLETASEAGEACWHARMTSHPATAEPLNRVSLSEQVDQYLLDLDRDLPATVQDVQVLRRLRQERTSWALRRRRVRQERGDI